MYKLITKIYLIGNSIDIVIPDWLNSLFWFDLPIASPVI